MTLGGLKPEVHAANDEIRQVVAKVADELKSKLNTTEVEPVSYKTQLVAGTNYFIKVKTPAGFAHARVYKDLQQNHSVHSVKADGITEESEIVYF
ncbi:cystatin A1 [Dictyostelium discoideum AX4]|uniref:Cystatin-A1 n=1 Tax=Dictyostelium discoideum TaxID=44689 RepID=CYTA1_DICDI|nr:cystatin A1 [Dictyostelium discoideum AX4]Q65YR8.1 RecName: Full=Cystatin-A1 [Dictyostelium discoideum]EAL61538.1 cystatin A1 [Dictyostelium discoideum AX4]BAD44693.1 cystatin A1 [Dictyostelium discoideum]|eukprot:XP_629960.1 cystatin A1 [Dictyostelium discoideum AX4]